MSQGGFSGVAEGLKEFHRVSVGGISSDDFQRDSRAFKGFYEISRVVNPFDPR